MQFSFSFSQMFYSKTKIQRTLPVYVSPQLAWWHTYKTGCQKLYEVFLPHCIAPILVSVHPDVNLKARPHLANIAVALTTFRLAYEEVREEVDQRLNEELELTLAQKNTLYDMKDLCEFFIPAVRPQSSTRLG